MLEARDVCFSYGVAGRVLDHVSLAVRPGEVVGLTGRSGVGKSTLGRILSGHYRPLSGRVIIDGEPHARGFNPVQYLSQSPAFSVDPRWTVGRVISEAWRPDEAMLRAFGVSEAWYDRYPHEISGGELQRVAVLRALAPDTRYLVADEISAPLDPLTQAQIWMALLAHAQKNGLGMLVISHDRPLLRRIAGRILDL